MNARKNNAPHEAFVSTRVWCYVCFLALFSVLSELRCHFAQFQYLKMPKTRIFLRTFSKDDARKNNEFVSKWIWHHVCSLGVTQQISVSFCMISLSRMSKLLKFRRSRLQRSRGTFHFLTGDARKNNAFVSTCVWHNAGLLWRCSSYAKNPKFSSLAPSALFNTVTGDAR